MNIFYKGRGEHSVKELEDIISHLLNERHENKIYTQELEEVSHEILDALLDEIKPVDGLMTMRLKRILEKNE